MSNETFVCVHVANSIRDGVACGFVYTSLNPDEEPCAYCKDCDAMLSANGGEWTEALEAKADIKLLCFGCFLKGAQLNGVLH
ncbi:MAG: hypothetical protein ISS15_03705 [Alphaproteobacteria bacterium]|nr:hypothetical protein [Alphaproteobacteria bacterium]MBL6939227.1 hypothetical protein [Alphaproteobacteria bacterium]MBL7096743.1 hypothetical protein [Alphaproteobacteria bacterium]